MMTAVLLGIAFLSAGAWSYNQLSAVTLPTPSYDLSLRQATGQAAPGDSITLNVADPNAPGGVATLGTAVVKKFTSGSEGRGSLVVEKVTYASPSADITAMRDQTIKAGGLTAQVSQVVGIPVFDLLYLQAGVGGFILLVGAIVTYWLVGVKRPAVDFLVDTDSEMKKVNWSTRREVLGSTWVVIGACFLIAAFLFLVDTTFSNVFRLIGVLQH